MNPSREQVAGEESSTWVQARALSWRDPQCIAFYAYMTVGAAMGTHVNIAAKTPSRSHGSCRMARDLLLEVPTRHGAVARGHRRNEMPLLPAVLGLIVAAADPRPGELPEVAGAVPRDGPG